MNKLNHYICENCEKIHIHGRTGKSINGGIPLFWTGSAVELNISGAELSFTYECHYESQEIYLRAEVDGADVCRMMLKSGIHTVPLYSGMDQDEKRCVRIFREMQANTAALRIISIDTDGELFPVENRPLIEFVGDSVTSGEGLMGAVHVNRWMPFVHSCRHDYALLTADSLNCDWSLVSQGGFGIYSAWNNNTDNVMPRLYDTVCMPATDSVQKSWGASEHYDFSRHPIITVVNLGANDCGAFGREPWIDKDGVSHQMRLEPDGSCNKDDLKNVYNSALVFCRKIRKVHPNTVIIWCYNMLSDRLNDTIISVMQEFKKEDKNGVSYSLKLPFCDQSLKGTRNHPSPAAHRLLAECLTNFIAKLNIL